MNCELRTRRHAHVGKRIRTAREQAGISREKLAEMIDSSISYIGRIESSNVNIVSLSKMFLITSALHLSIDELLLETDAFIDQRESLMNMLQSCTDYELKVIDSMARAFLSCEIAKEILGEENTSDE